MSLLDQFGKTVSKPGQQTMPQQGSAYLDGLAQSKDEVTQEISRLFMELGKAYYEAHNSDLQTEFEGQMAGIRAGYEKIARCEQEAEEIAAHKRCPSCGAQLVEGSMFCSFCGVRLPEFIDSAEQPPQNVCPRCQAVIHPGDLFCVECGADLRGIV